MKKILRRRGARLGKRVPRNRFKSNAWIHSTTGVHHEEKGEGCAHGVWSKAYGWSHSRCADTNIKYSSHLESRTLYKSSWLEWSFHYNDHDPELGRETWTKF